jgi:hypothetical protein
VTLSDGQQGGTHFVFINTDRSALELTIGTVAVEGASFGRIKSLYR